MRKLFSLLFLLVLSTIIFAQEVKLSSAALCNIQVALAISEGDDFGEYSVTRLIEVKPGQLVNLNSESFQARRIYSNISFDEALLVRFSSTGLSHFFNARMPDGFEQIVKGACTENNRLLVQKKNGLINLSVLTE
jgi:hypothetical protein